MSPGLVSGIAVMLVGGVLIVSARAMGAANVSPGKSKYSREMLVIAGFIIIVIGAGLCAAFAGN